MKNKNGLIQIRNWEIFFFNNKTIQKKVIIKDHNTNYNYKIENNYQINQKIHCVKNKE